MSEQEKKPSSERMDAVIRIGRQMSNLCFNLSQGVQVAGEHREMMRQLQKEWDASILDLRKEVKAAPDADAELLNDMAIAFDLDGSVQASLFKGLSARLRAIAQRLPRWIPVSERLPEPNPRNPENNSIHVLLCDRDGQRSIGRLWFKEETHTHWMPLPAPPAERPSQKEGE